MTNLNNYTLLKLRSGHRFDVVFSCIPSVSTSACKEILSPAFRSDFISNKIMRWCVRHRAVSHGGGLKNDPHISVLLFKLLALCTMFIQ